MMHKGISVTTVNIAPRVAKSFYGKLAAKIGWIRMGKPGSKVTSCRIAKIAAAITLSYPPSGFAAAPWMLIRDLPWTIRNPSHSLLDALLIAVWYGVSVPVHGVFPELDAAGICHFPAYPFVIPTLLALLFIFFADGVYSRCAASGTGSHNYRRVGHRSGRVTVDLSRTSRESP
jgi:hypothetical protein